MKLLKKLHTRDLKGLKRFSFILILVFVMIFSLPIVHIVNGITMEPGSDEDPLVSKSFSSF